MIRSIGDLTSFILIDVPNSSRPYKVLYAVLDNDPAEVQFLARTDGTGEWRITACGHRILRPQLAGHWSHAAKLLPKTRDEVRELAPAALEIRFSLDPKVQRDLMHAPTPREIALINHAMRQLDSDMWLEGHNRELHALFTAVGNRFGLTGACTVTRLAAPDRDAPVNAWREFVIRLLQRQDNIELAIASFGLTYNFERVLGTPDRIPREVIGRRICHLFTFCDLQFVSVLVARFLSDRHIYVIQSYD